MAAGTLITTPFGYETTAAEVVDGVDLTGRRAIVTGGASGIGVETARALAGAGADVTLAVRDTAAGDRTAADITGTTGRDVHVARLDLADQASVAAFAAGWNGPLHILVNNAGVMAIQEPEQSPEGWELQFATNHLGHFALTTRPARGARGGGRRARRLGQLGRAPALAGDLRRPALRVPPVRPVARLRPVQDGERPLRGRGGPALGRRRHPRQRADARRHRHEPAAPRRPGADRERAHSNGFQLQDARAGRRDLGAAGRVAAGRGRRRPLLRGRATRPTSSIAAAPRPSRRASPATRSTRRTPSASGRSPRSWSAERAAQPPRASMSSPFDIDDLPGTSSSWARS